MDLMRKFDHSLLTLTNLYFLMFLNDRFLTYLSASFRELAWFMFGHFMFFIIYINS